MKRIRFVAGVAVCCVTAMLTVTDRAEAQAEMTPAQRVAIEEALPDGPIVPVNFHGYNHYVVYKGLTPEGKVRLADPAHGNRTLTRERFERVWMEGMAFTLLRQDI